MRSNRDDHLIHAQTELFGGGLHDADIGLMRYQPIDIGTLQIVFCEHFFDHFTEHLDGKFKNRLAFHLDERIALYFTAADVALSFQHAAMAAIRMQFAGDNARGCRSPQHHCTRSIPK